MTRPLLKQGRIWTACLWAATVAVGLGSLHAAWVFMARTAQTQAALLVPALAWDASQRERALAEIQAYPEVRESGWISPSELARETGELLPPERWPEILSEEDSWLPWVLEIRWRDPLLTPDAIRWRVEALRLDAQWKFVLWDDEILLRRRGALVTVLVLGGSGLGLIFLLGLIALATGPRRERGALAEGLMGALLAMGSVALMGVAAMLEGFYPEDLTWGIAGTTAFLLAGVIAPMIKRPRSVPDSKIHAEAPEESVTSLSEPLPSPETPPPSEELQNASQ